jgi:membrane-bound inhibitor of C-type lysozyme
MAVAGPRNLSLEQLDRQARTFADISDETGARYSAGAFVRWLRAEATHFYNDPAGRPGQMVARSPRCSP